MAEKYAPDPHAGGEGAPDAKKPRQRANEFTEFERLFSHEVNADYEEVDLFREDGDGLLSDRDANSRGQKPSVKPLRPGETRSVRIPVTIESPGGDVCPYELGLTISLRRASSAPPAAAAHQGVGAEPPEDDIDLLDGRTTLFFADQDEDADDEPEPSLEPSRGWWSKLFSFWR